MTKAICSVDGCEGESHAHGWCEIHYQRVWRRGTTDKRAFPKVCSIVDCGSAVKARGFCAKHYQRFQVHGDALYERPAGACEVVGCEEGIKSYRLCAKHLERMQRNGTTDLLPYSADWNPTDSSAPLCSVGFCHRPMVYPTSGLCAAHYQQERKGKPFTPTRATRPSGVKTCIADGCDGRHVAGGLCSTHHARLRKYGLTPDAFDKMLAAQGSGCATCGTAAPGARGWHVDHDHACCPGQVTCGKCVRGILCHPCNRALGVAHDNAELLQAMADYLRITQRPGATSS